MYDTFAATLYSSSSGNCTYFRHGGEEFLIDAGVSARMTNQSLRMLGTDFSRISKIFITHGHSDHIKGVETIAKYYNIKFYAPYQTCCAIRNKIPAISGKLFALNGGEIMKTENMTIKAFETPHDAESSVCYRFETEDCKFGYATDIGHLTAEIGECLMGCDSIVIESNHDLDMLKNGFYPYFLKRRILGEYGHLSNKSCAAALPRLIESGVRNIVLAHLSNENNRPHIAYNEAKSVLAEKNISISTDNNPGDITLSVASPNETVIVLSKKLTAV